MPSLHLTAVGKGSGSSQKGALPTRAFPHCIGERALAVGHFHTTDKNSSVDVGCAAQAYGELCRVYSLRF